MSNLHKSRTSGVQSQSTRLKTIQYQQLMFTDPQADLTRMSHKDNFNQMQSLGDALSRKGNDDFEDPDFDEINPNTHMSRK